MKKALGGSRKGAGRLKTTIKISPEDAKTLRFLAGQQGSILHRAVTVEEMASRLIRAEWQRYDDEIQKAIEKVAMADEPYIL